MEASRVIRSRTALGLGLLVCALAVLPAASASADFSPHLQISFDPATAGKPVAITSVLTQAQGQTPSKTVTVSFPPGFTVNAGTTAKICHPDPDPERPLRCPADTQIGTAKAIASAFGLAPEFDGFVYFGGPVEGTVGSLKLLILLQNPAFPDQRIDGIASLRPDGGYDNKFDNLPNILVTNFTLALDGDSLALLQSPAKCGKYTMAGSYVSQNGETSAESVPFNVKCATASKRPRVAGLSLSRSGVASFTLSRAGKVRLALSRGGRAVRTRTITGRRGANHVRMARLEHGKSYSISAVGANIVRRSRVG
jgi:hypothetical protein